MAFCLALETPYRARMQPRWLEVTWAGCAAACVGFLVAALSGTAPPWWLLALFVALPAIMTLAVRTLERRPLRSSPDQSTIRFRGERRSLINSINRVVARVSVVTAKARAVTRSSATDPEPPEASLAGEASSRKQGAARKSRPRKNTSESVVVGGSITDHHKDVLGQICRALNTRQIAWLRSFDYSAPWLDVHARAALDIEPLVEEIVDAPFAADVYEALRILSRQLRAFSAYYSQNTSADPVLVGGDWRFFFLQPDAAPGEAIPEDLTPGVELCELSRAFADSYVTLVDKSRYPAGLPRDGA